MDTPEEVLEATLRLKWPDSGLDWQEVIRTVMGFGDLLRLPEDMKRRRQKAAVAAEPKDAPEHERLRSMGKAERVAHIFRHATRPMSSADIAGQADCSVSLVTIVAAKLKADRVGHGSSTVWLPLRRGSAPSAELPKGVLRSGPRGTYPELPGRVRELLEEAPRSARDAARELGVDRRTVRHVMKSIGARLRGHARNAAWELPAKSEEGAA